MKASLFPILLLLPVMRAWPAPAVTEILGRPTESSVTVNARADAALELYFEYDASPGEYNSRTTAATAAAGVPVEQLLDGLLPNTRYYYRMRYRGAASADAFTAGTEHSFHTQRAPGSTYTFCIQGDSHPERASQFDSALYLRTLQTVAADRPDFYLMIGDDFSVDTLKTLNAATVAERYTLQLPYLGLVGTIRSPPPTVSTPETRNRCRTSACCATISPGPGEMRYSSPWTPTGRPTSPWTT